jgi:hypothetical protein
MIKTIIFLKSNSNTFYLVLVPDITIIENGTIIFPNLAATTSPTQNSLKTETCFCQGSSPCPTISSLQEISVFVNTFRPRVGLIFSLCFVLTNSNCMHIVQNEISMYHYMCPLLRVIFYSQSTVFDMPALRLVMILIRWK